MKAKAIVCRILQLLFAKLFFPFPLKIKMEQRARSILKSHVCSQTKLHSTQFNLCYIFNEKDITLS